MNLLSQASKGKLHKPHRILIYGPDGVGKSTFGADAPNPIFLGSEDGTSNMDVTRFPKPRNIDDIFTAIANLTTEAHEHKTLVIDSLDWMEPMLWDAICVKHKKNSINDVGGGFGKGYEEANNEWRALMRGIEMMQEKRQMNVIAVAHSQIKPFTDPEKNAAYDRYQLKLNEKAAALWREFVETVLFANFKTFVKDTDERKAKAFGDGARVMYTERRPAWDAKNRLGLPFSLPLDWNEYQKAVLGGKNTSKIKENIYILLDGISDAELVKRVSTATEAAEKDPEKLDKILNKLQSILEAK